MNNTAQSCRSSIVCILSLVAFCFTNAQQTQVNAQVVATQGESLEEPQGFLGDRGIRYTMTITPAVEAKPAFKHRLFVPRYKTVPGNAVTHYLRPFGDGSLSDPWRAAEKEFGDEALSNWFSLKTPVSDIPLESLKKVSSGFDSYVDNHIRRASKCREADWGLAVEDLKGIENINFTLPSIQQTRRIARALMLRNRLAVIEGRYEDSVENIGMIYKLGENVNEQGFLVSNVVAAAQVGMANECMIDLVSSPSSPNMYWALAELPRPILSFRKSFRLEANFPERFLPELDGIETAEYSDEEWKRRLVSVIDFTTQVGAATSLGSVVGSQSRQNELLAFAVGLAGYSGAKQRLLDAGMNAERVAAMSAAQVLLIDFKRDLNCFANEFEKALYVPYQDSIEFNDRAEKLVATPFRMGAVFIQMLWPSTEQVRETGERVQAGTDSLMVIESIRHHVATTGDFPATLGDLELSVVDNAFTGKPFGYRVRDGKAVLDVEAGGWPKQYVISIATQEPEAAKGQGGDRIYSTETSP